MELLKLQKRINENLDLVNNAKSISIKRRYFVYLCTLVEIYNELAHEDIQVAKYDNNKIMKRTFSESLLEEVFEEFISSLGCKYELIYRNILENNNLFLSKKNTSGSTIFDYEAYSSEEILERLPFINSISNFNILTKHLKN